jgi:phosphoglycerol transferase MdoB-like AlkP superfamily enzyme
MSKNAEDQSLPRSFAIFIISLFFAIGGIYGTASLFDAMNWAYFHSWALIHGTGYVCILFWAFLGYHIGKLLFHSSGQFSPIPNLAYVCTALGTLLHVWRPWTTVFMWLGLVLSSMGVYSRIRNGKKAAAGLMWTAFIVSLLCVAFWTYNKWLFANIARTLQQR